MVLVAALVALPLFSCCSAVEGKSLKLRRDDWYTKKNYTFDVPSLSLPDLSPTPGGLTKTVLTEDIPDNLAKELEKTTQDWVNAAWKDTKMKVKSLKVRSDELGYPPSSQEAKLGPNDVPDEVQAEGDRILREMQSNLGLRAARLNLPDGVIPDPDVVPDNPLSLGNGPPVENVDDLGPGDMVNESHLRILETQASTH
mmetsp:Transcript_58142/g.101795  ORF Transcript_58142/g.101795 Transcript_58142/m.101795 type:complete len:198 (-) Transcript_58142:13-606(-)